MTDHKKQFGDFARWEIASGGPDPHLKMVVDLARGCNDPAWFVGCYTAPYVVSTAEVLAAHWTRHAALANPSGLATWIGEHWQHLPIRKERKVNGTGPAKMAEILVRYAEWLEGPRRPVDTFAEAWAHVSSVPHHGRYFGMKLYETLRRVTGLLPDFVDVMPKNGSLARRGLALLHPEHDPKDDSSRGLEEANELSNALRQELSVDWFTIEVLLCNYRQAAAGRQYPGRAHDSELGHYYVTQAGFPQFEFKTLTTRRVFPAEHLGEDQGWNGRRKELGRVMNEHGYIWSDLAYDYRATNDLTNPARRTR